MSDTADRTPPHVPDVGGLSAHRAALAYADAGLWVLPVASGKHPGSVVGRGWPEQSTRDPELIGAYWDRDDEPGIAIHLGRSRLVAVDLDIAAIPDEFAWLRKGLFQSSRGGRDEQGHYVFATTEIFRNVKLALSDGPEIGDIRTGNAVILAQPSPHPKAGIGGCYLWQQSGDVPELPADGHTALAVLSAKAGGVGDEGGPVSVERVRAWCESHTAETESWRRKALRNKYAERVADGENRHDAMVGILGWAAREVAPGLISAEVFPDLRADWIDSYRATGDTPQRGDFTRMVHAAITAVVPADGDPAMMADLRARAHREFGTDHRDDRNSAHDMRGWLDQLASDDAAQQSSPSARTRFVGVSAAELAAPLTPMRWLIRDVWPQRSAGVLAGEKKTFKTWNLQAMALAVSAGVPFLGTFAVTRSAPVLYLCGEGGRDGFANRHQVIAAQYGITSDDLGSLPFVAEFDTDELTSSELIDGVKRHLDRLQPELVILDPLYAYHPASVEASNLYARGPMLAKLREGIESHAALVIGDHFKKGSGDGFDLDHISMAGVGQWADSWALQRHRTEPDVANNDYRIEVEFSTRRSGGRRWHIDWHLDRDPDPDVVSWARARWSVIAPTAAAVNPARDVELRIIAEVTQSPWTLTRSTLLAAIGGRRDAVFKAITRLIDGCELAERAPATGKGKAMVLGPGKIVAPMPGGVR
ncbi:AAA family ATPase [Mycobacterium kyogaense]|uniref:AAA family ATPase n=1 Tax=Mycobacterium kyogaense TaxID=2212479 RepID=UPI0013C5051F|nr:AAA family ATPase [Mycobacterium kyogaense]